MSTKTSHGPTCQRRGCRNPRSCTHPVRRTTDDCTACDGTGQHGRVYDGVVALEQCDICGGSGVDR